METEIERVTRLAPAAILAALLALAACGPQPAEILILNARVYTVNPAEPWAEAVAIAGGRIAFVGSDAGAEAFRDGSTRTIDAQGRLLLPGFVDSHNHIFSGADPDRIQLGGARDLDDIRSRVREFSNARPDLPWILGDGWNYSIFPVGTLPSMEELDGITGGRPAMLTAYDAHTMWFNAKALDLLGIDETTESVGFGELQRHEDGRPTGIIFGGSAGGDSSEGTTPWDLIPERSEEDRYQGLIRNFARASRFGITTIVDPQAAPEDLPLHERALAEGHLKSRLRLALDHPRGTTAEDVAHFAELRDRNDDGRIRVTALKLYIDDVIEPHTAALLAPYSDAPHTAGDTFYEPGEFDALVAGLDARGFQLFIHAIGDRGVRTALDALEYAQNVNGARDARHQLVHVELLSPDDVTRFDELGVVACMQPRHLAPDITGQWSAAVGPGRSRYAWALRSLIDAGAVLAFASDWDVAEMEPLVGIYTAVTRRALDGTPEDGWIPAQRISVADAVRGYTRGGAYANFAEDELGSIERGKLADLVLLSEDILSISPERILETRVLVTLAGGEEVYRADDFE